MYSAGILIYFIQNDVAYFLLGKDSFGYWSDFGGKEDFIDLKNPLYTAAREFYEETAGVLYSRLETQHIVCSFSRRFICASYKQNKYYMHLVKKYVDIAKVTNRFDNMRAILNSHRGLERFKEKVSIALFTINDIQSNPTKFRSVFYKSFMQNIDEIQRCVSI